jgi:heme/copper-type cytochrome/quinol oxidase subunit 2
MVKKIRAPHKIAWAFLVWLLMCVVFVPCLVIWLLAWFFAELYRESKEILDGLHEYYEKVNRG